MTSAKKTLKIKTETVRSTVNEKRQQAKDELRDLVFSILGHRNTKANEDRLAKEQQKEALNAWERTGTVGQSLTLISATDANTYAEVTRVQSVRSRLDETALKKALGTRAFRKLCTEQIDEAKVQDAVTRGDIPSHVVAQCMYEEPSAPYLKITQKTTDTQNGAQKP